MDESLHTSTLTTPHAQGAKPNHPAPCFLHPDAGVLLLGLLLRFTLFAFADLLNRLDRGWSSRAEDLASGWSLADRKCVFRGAESWIGSLGAP